VVAAYLGALMPARCVGQAVRVLPQLDVALDHGQHRNLNRLLQ
jgi:hypothetical protein